MTAPSVDERLAALEHPLEPGIYVEANGPRLQAAIPEWIALRDPVRGTV